MRIIRDYRNPSASAKGGALALGNFDGVHLGHRAILEHTISQAERLNAPSLVMTFEPHPASVLKPDMPPFRLTSFRQKTERLNRTGIDYMVVAHFTQRFAERSAEAFVKELLVEKLAIRHIVIGHDLMFGENRQGNEELLKEMGRAYHFGVTVLEPIGNGTRYSSSLIRRLLREGNIAEANTMLGHPFTIEGKIKKGAGRGHTLGFPTANITLGEYIRPKFGVYAVEARLEKGTWRKAVANLGKKPTFGEELEVLEVHVPDESGDWYGERMEVRFLTYLRPEKAFASVEELKAQIAKDCLIAMECRHV